MALHRASGLINAYLPVHEPENLRPMHAQAVLETRFCHAVQGETRVFATAADRHEPPRRLGDLPLIVLTAARGAAADAPMADLRLPAKTMAAWDASWMALQSTLARLSTRGDHRIVEDAGHFLHLDRPDAVVEAVRDVITMAQGRSSPAPGDR
jgi:pimeloyl-ACP methyl ester carboxylesterase